MESRQRLANADKPLPDSVMSLLKQPSILICFLQECPQLFHPFDRIDLGRRAHSESPQQDYMDCGFIMQFRLRASRERRRMLSVVTNSSYRAALKLAVVAGTLMSAGSLPARAQDNYEIQIYPAETQKPGTLLLELHSNYTVEGSATPNYGMLPTQGQEHETIELTQGINNWSEVVFYIFTEEHNGTGVQWVGDHIRPRVRVPASWHWPVGVSLSNKIGYARAAYANPTWSWQIMPIVDQTIGKWYWSVNTTMNWGIHPTSLPPGTSLSQVNYYYRNVSPG